jgi:putative MFS transporter
MTSSSGASVEATRVSPYLLFLFALLSTATLFEGFDSAMMTMAAPDTRSSLDISLGEWGVVFAITRAGMIASFFFLLFADRWGRRALLMITVVGFTLCNGLTALATTKAEFTLYQFLARLFLTAEYGLAVIIIGEEYPARFRGRATAVLMSLAPIGVILVAIVQAYVLLEPGAAGNWLHDSGVAVLVAVQGTLGMEVRPEDWRVLYLLGVFPLAIVLLMQLGMQETRRFDAERRTHERRRGLIDEMKFHLRNARAPWGATYRRRTWIVVLLWNCVHLVTAPAVAFWVIYAREELGLTPHHVKGILSIGYAGGFVGSFAAGFLVDWIGRKRTCALLYVFASFAIFFLFQTRSIPAQYVFMIATVFAFGAAGTATHIYASELFPTAIRATGYGWTTNLFGRATEVLVPLGVGLFIGSLGISWSVGIFAFGPILGAIVVWRVAPETSGMTLEEIQEALGGGQPELAAVAADVPKRVGSAGS